MRAAYHFLVFFLFCSAHVPFREGGAPPLLPAYSSPFFTLVQRGNRRRTSPPPLEAPHDMSARTKYSSLPLLLRSSLEPLSLCHISPPHSYVHVSEVNAGGPYYVHDPLEEGTKLGQVEDESVAALLASACLVDGRVRSDPLGWLSRMRDPSSSETWVVEMGRGDRFERARSLRKVDDPVLERRSVLSSSEELDDLVRLDSLLSHIPRDMLSHLPLSTIHGFATRIDRLKADTVPVPRGEDSLDWMRAHSEEEERRRRERASSALFSEELSFRIMALGDVYTNLQFEDVEKDALRLVFSTKWVDVAIHLVERHGFRILSDGTAEGKFVSLSWQNEGSYSVLEGKDPSLLSDLMWTFVLLPSMRRRIGKTRDALHSRQEERDTTLHEIVSILSSRQEEVVPLSLLPFRNRDRILLHPHFDVEGRNVSLSFQAKDVSHVEEDADMDAEEAGVPLLCVKWDKMRRGLRYGPNHPITSEDVASFLSG